MLRILVGLLGDLGLLAGVGFVALLGSLLVGHTFELSGQGVLLLWVGLTILLLPVVVVFLVARVFRGSLKLAREKDWVLEARVFFSDLNRELTALLQKNSSRNNKSKGK